MDLLSSFGMGAVGKVFDYVDTAVQYFNQKKLNRQAQNDTQENMRLQKELNLQQQFDSVKSYTSALRNAGLNPALASSSPIMAQGVSSAAGNAGQAAKPENSFASTLEAANALSKQSAEIENLQANTSLQKAEAKLKEQDIQNKKQEVKESESRVSLNETQESMLQDLSKKYQTEGLILGTEYSRMLSQDNFSHHALMDYCDRRISSASSEPERDFWTALRAIGAKNKFDAGAVMAMSLWSEAWNSLDKTEQEIGARAILRQIQDIQVSDSEFLDVIAHMPVYQASLLFGQTAEAYQNAAFRKAYRLDLLPLEKSKLDEDIRVQKHNDPAGMLEDGDLLGFGVYGAGQILRWIPQFYMARQFGKGGSLPNPQGKQPNGEPKASSSGGTPDKTAPIPKPSKPPQAAADDAVKRRLYSSFGVEKTDKLWNGYRKSDARSFDEYLKREGIGVRRNYSASDWMQ